MPSTEKSETIGPSEAREAAWVGITPFFQFELIASLNKSLPSKIYHSLFWY